jgi:hypothetical protein
MLVADWRAHVTWCQHPSLGFRNFFSFFCFFEISTQGQLAPCSWPVGRQNIMVAEASSRDFSPHCLHERERTEPRTGITFRGHLLPPKVPTTSQNSPTSKGPGKHSTHELLGETLHIQTITCAFILFTCKSSKKTSLHRILF